MSNEVFYEIFDYLDGYAIYKSFSNLNIRFENLMKNLSFLMKIEFSSTSVFDDDYKQFLRTNEYHIRSLHFSNESIVDRFISLYIIDSSFNRLESLVFDRISTFKFLVLLFYLKCLPRLFSLTVKLSEFSDELGDVYQILFRLPFLKYLKIDLTEYEQSNIVIPIAVDGQFSSIEYLIIEHHCSLNELTDLMSYTPRLSHLSLICIYLDESDGEINSEVLKKLMNLVHFTSSIYNCQFDEFEEFLSKISSRLKLLSVTTRYSDKKFLDSGRWEQLISQYMPDLNRLNFCYSDTINDDFEIDASHSLINGFTSDFWLKRKWIFKLFISKNELIYLIRSHRYRFSKRILSLLSSFSERVGSIIKNMSKILMIIIFQLFNSMSMVLFSTQKMNH